MLEPGVRRILIRSLRKTSSKGPVYLLSRSPPVAALDAVELVRAAAEQGERTIERLLSASITCRLQRRSLFAYLTEVLNASIRGDPIPLLV